MLTNLHIENIAVIEKADIEFSGGFNVLTGETGAGKSIIIDSINMVLGQRTSRDLIRSGSDRASVTALFTNINDESATAKLVELGVSPDEDGCLLITRELSQDGKGSVRLNGKPTTASIIREVGSLLLNIHGQHDNQSLLAPSKHMDFLDRYGNVTSLLDRYSAVYKEFVSICKELDDLAIEDDEKEQRIELLKHQIKELTEADLEEDEEDVLNSERTKLMNAAKIIEAVKEAYEYLYGENGSVNEFLYNASLSLDVAEKFETALSEVKEKIETINYEVEECADKLRRVLDGLDYEDGYADEIEARLDLIYKMKRRYGGSVAACLKYLKKAEDELEKIEFSEERIEKLTKQKKEVSAQLKKAAETLSAARKQSAERMQEQIKSELSFLDMAKVQFKVNIDAVEYGHKGGDSVEFLIATNMGEPLKPLSKIASGGELSRIMLSLQNVLASRGDVGTMIFDEVDSGVSGKAAEKIGRKLVETAQGRQIICITHLAQIAALADNHLLIEKQVRGERTYTQVHPLERDGRINEIARIMGGEVITELTRKNAEEMIDKR